MQTEWFNSGFVAAISKCLHGFGSDGPSAVTRFDVGFVDEYADEFIKGGRRIHLAEAAYCSILTMMRLTQQPLPETLFAKFTTTIEWVIKSAMIPGQLGLKRLHSRFLIRAAALQETQ